MQDDRKLAKSIFGAGSKNTPQDIEKKLKMIKLLRAVLGIVNIIL